MKAVHKVPDPLSDPVHAGLMASIVIELKTTNQIL
jgi:hypothetical protein